MVLIQHAIIYKLENLITGHFYIGSTFQKLYKRLSSHKCESKKFPNRKIYQYINDWENTEIKCIDYFECHTKMEKEKKEHEYIKEHFNNPLCVNSKITGWNLSLSDLKELPHIKEMVKEGSRKYYVKNKDEINRKRREKYRQNKTIKNK